VADLDEAGFEMTLPTAYSWFPRGKRFRVRYQAPEGRRVNAIGLHFTHGPLSGRLVYRSFAQLPKSRAKKARKTLLERARSYGFVSEAQVGPIEASRFLDFVWSAAGRPPVHALDWKRERPLVIVLDNYSVHVSEPVAHALAGLEAANIFLFYLPSYCPEMSGIEPVWQDVKYRELQERSHSDLVAWKAAIDAALERKAIRLSRSEPEATSFGRMAA
jgi:hypothetical protein